MEELNPNVEPVAFNNNPGGEIEVEVHQLVKASVAMFCLMVL
jgi:hypothetical protein